MWVIIRILCLLAGWLWTVDGSQKVLNLTLLNVGETVSLSLANYLQAPKQATLDKVHSKNIDSLAIELTTAQPILNVSSVPLQMRLPNGSDYTFNSSDVLQSCSLYNQPNKLFLMRGNIVVSIRYQFSTSDAPFSVAVTTVDASEQCSELNVMENYGNYYAVVGCMRSENESVLHAFRFNSTNPSAVNGLIPLNTLPLPVSSCINLESYSFRTFFLSGKTYVNSILYFCATGRRAGEPSNLYFLFIENRKGIDNLTFTEPIYSLPARSLRKCLAGTEWLGKYEQGILILRGGDLFYFKYDPAGNDGVCQLVLEVAGVRFVDAVEEQDIQYVYVMFDDKLIIKESYSPNFQTVPLRHAANLTLHSYAITRRFLALLFANATHQSLTVYDLPRAYPTELDQLSWTKTRSQLTIFPVGNFLEGGNYYLSTDTLTGQLVLNFYQGYLLTFSIKDPVAALPHVTLNISNQQNQNLVLQCLVRDFNDSSISQATDSRFLKTYREVLSVNLSDYVQGPLGRFYNYPNNISAFQYINAFSELDLHTFVKTAGRPLAISFNNYLNAAVINFYYSTLAKTCELEFAPDTQRISLSDCKTLTRKRSLIEAPTEILVLSEDKYLQHNHTILEYCALSSNNEFECQILPVSGTSGWDCVYLVSYQFAKDGQEAIELLIHGDSDVIYCCLLRKAYSRAPFTYNLHYHASPTNLPDLVGTTIRALRFDPGYTQFLAVWLSGANGDQVLVFDKPTAVRNTSSFIGHVLQKLEFPSLQGVFGVGSLLMCVWRAETQWRLQEYKVTRYYRVRETRRYPLYHLTVAEGGAHKQDGDFIYLEALESGRRVYAVYSPLRPSSGVLSHKFAKLGSLGLVFAQQIGQVSGNSMGLNGQRLFGLVPPTLTFKFLSEKVDSVKENSVVPWPRMGKYEFQVSVLDSAGMMNLLAYEFDYNQGQEIIRYDDVLFITLRFDANTRYSQFAIDPQKVHGPVNGYELKLSGEGSCGFFSVQGRDVFTKEGCLAYSNPVQLGTLSDFLALWRGGVNMELLVSEQALVCVVDRHLRSSQSIVLNGLAACKFEQSGPDILMVCDNATSIGKLLFNVTVGSASGSCLISMTQVKLPRWLGYPDFAVRLSGQWLLLEVPIRSRQNSIYYKTTISDNIISDSYSLLVGSSPAVTEFDTRDTSISPALFFILDNGIGIYNLSDSAKEIRPALWMSRGDFFSVPADQSALVYLKWVGLNGEGTGQMQIILEVGSEESAYEIAVSVVVGASSDGQSNYSKLGVRVVYQYRQYMSCKNNVHSKSQNYGSLIIKTCSYEPPDQLVFANFVSVSNETTGPLIQFYNRSGAASFPFRIDTIYSNSNSHHSFLIRNNTLMVASLFNLLCYYALANTLRWQFLLLNASTVSPDRDHNDLSCKGKLIISNLQFRKELQLQVVYDYDQQEEDYWSNGAYYIQRVAVVLLLGNAIRLLWRARSKRTTKLRKRLSTRLHTNRFEVMVKINSKKST